MDDVKQEWQKKFWTNFGAWEYIRLSCSFVLWMFLAVALGLVFNISGITVYILVTAFLIAPFTFAIISRTRKPAYSLLRKILGNKNLPSEPMPLSTIKILRPSLPWWGYVPGIWHIFMDLAILYIIIRYFSK